jgi:hypothetical protein
MPHVSPPAAHTLWITDDRARLSVLEHPDLKSMSRFLALTRCTRAQCPDGPHGKREEQEWKG